MMYDYVMIVIALFFVFFLIYMAYRHSQVTKKTFHFINESHQLARETLEVNKKMLKELETISKNLKK